MPARRLPAAPGGGLLRRDPGAPAHKRAPDGPTSGGGGPRLLSASWWADGAGPSRPPSPAQAPARSSAALAPAPAPRAPALPPAAEALVRRRPPCAPPPPSGPAPRARPADPSAPPALAGLVPARAATALRLLRPGAHPEPGSPGVEGRGEAKGRRGPALGTTSCSKVFSGKKFGSGLRKDPALTVALLEDNWHRFASQ